MQQLARGWLQLATAGRSLPPQRWLCVLIRRQQANERRQGAAGRLEPRPALPRLIEAAVAGRFSRCAHTRLFLHHSPLVHTCSCV